MTFFIDNNFSPKIAHALSAVGEDVTHLRDHFSPSTPDEDWIPDVAGRGWLAITRDEKITRKPGQVRVMRDAGLGIFVFVQKAEPQLWGWFDAFVRRWPEFRVIADRRSPPFVARVPQRGRIDVR